jgi:CubicO group peptidase (beta-lactamase class C family)
METAGFAADARTLHGYNQAFGQPIFLYDTMQPPAPSGGAVTSAEDMARLVQLYLDDGSPLLEPGLAALALTPSGVDSNPDAPGGYGMGWYTAEHDGIQYLTHGGDIDSFHADMALLPGSGLGVVLLYNTNNLFANFSVFPATINGAVKILSGGETPEGGITMRAFGVVMLAWLLWSLYSGIRKLLAADAWAGRAQNWSTLRRAAALVGSLIPAFILVFLPQLVLLISGRTAPLKLLFSYLPDVLFILAAASVLGVTQFILRVRALRAGKQSL